MSQYVVMCIVIQWECIVLYCVTKISAISLPIFYYYITLFLSYRAHQNIQIPQNKTFDFSKYSATQRFRGEGLLVIVGDNFCQKSKNREMAFC